MLILRPVRPAPLVAAAALALLMAAAASPAAAQSGPFTGASADGEGDQAPIEIEAEDGIEWLRDAKRYIARGDATATRQGVTVRADTLTAYYRGGEDGERQVIFRIDADANVTITQGETQAIGDKGVYHVERKVAVLVGEDLKLIGEEATITAEESLEYWEERQLAVARGDATIFQEGNRLVADILTAYIRPGEDGKTEITRIDALGGVHISTGQEIVRGAEGVYNVPEEVATVCGSVKITRGENQLNGECAVVDMKTGRSRLSGAEGGGRVKGLILPTE